jgi:hypothetical protein
VPNQVSAMPWKVMGELKYSSTLLYLYFRLMWVVSFSPRMLYPEEKHLCNPVAMRLCGPHNYTHTHASTHAHNCTPPSRLFLQCYGNTHTYACLCTYIYIHIQLANFIRETLMKSKRTRRSGRVARMRQMYTTFWLKWLMKDWDRWGIILKWIL